MRARLLATVLLLAPLSASAAITGTVMTVDGQPISGARVSAFATEGFHARLQRLVSKTPDRTPVATAQTDTKGNFTIDPGKDPAYTLRVEAAGYAPSGRIVESGDDAGGIALVTAATKKGTITGAGKPLAGATVIWQGRGVETIAITDGGGSYSVPDPARWALRVTILHPEFAVTEIPFDRFSNRKASADQSLPSPAVIRGRVTSEDGTTPASGAQIFADGWPVATAGEDGSFTAKVPAKWEMVEARSGSLVGLRARSGAADSLSVRLSRAPVISGIVRDARTGGPLGSVTVSAMRAVRGPRLMSINPTASTLTDAKGQYSLIVPPGEYQLAALRTGYDLAEAPAAVTAAQKLVKNLTVSQLGRISGLVVDEEKKPTAAATITTEDVGEDRDPMNRRRMFAAREAVSSAPDGRFSIYVEGDADMQLVGSKKGLPEGRSSTLRLAAGERRRGATLIIPRGYAVTGRVVDANGKPVAGVTVAYTNSEGEGGRGPGGMMRRTVVLSNQQDDQRVESAADGTFALRVREGMYDFLFTREGFAPKTVRGQRVAADLAPLEVALAPGAEIAGRVVRDGAGVEGVTINVLADIPQATTSGPDGTFRVGDLVPGQTMLLAVKPEEFIQQSRSVTVPDDDIVIEIPPGGRISGRVVDKTTRKPITTFQVNASPQRGAGMMIVTAQNQRTMTSDDGSFVLENVPAGTVMLTVGATGYTTARVQNLTVEAGKTLSDIEVALDIGVRLFGKVTGPDGSPVAGVAVRAEGRGPGRFMGGGMEGNTFTDANGEYGIEAVEPGEKTYAFSHPRYLSQRKDVNLSGREVRLDVTLAAGQRVTGVVVTDGGAPVADASVRASSASDSSFGREARTDANGSFSFEGLAPATYTFFASKSGYATGNLRDFDIRGGASPRIVLTSGGTIYGRVLGLQESEKGNAQVIASGAASSAEGAVDANGNFRIEGSPVGNVRVYASTRRNFGAGRDSAWKSIEVRPGSPVQVDLEFNSGTIIRGRVTRAGGPLAGAIVRFDPRSATAQTRATTTANGAGNYEVTGLDDGTYVVGVMDTERGMSTLTYEVRGSGTFDIDLKTATVRGRVVDATTRQPIEQAEVQLRPSSQEQFFMLRGGTTDASGTFVIENVSPGSYTIRALKTGYGHDAQDLTVGDSAPAIELELPRSDGLTLHVVDARTGVPLSASAYVVDSKGRVVNDGFFDNSPGAVRISLSPGQYRATVIARGYAPQTITVIAPSEQRVGLTPGGTLVIRSKGREVRRGRLVDAAGQPHLPRNAYFPIDSSPGVATVRFIAPGVYTLQIVDDNDAVIASLPGVGISEGGTTEVDF